MLHFITKFLPFKLIWIGIKIPILQTLTFCQLFSPIFNIGFAGRQSASSSGTSGGSSDMILECQTFDSKHTSNMYERSELCLRHHCKPNVYNLVLDSRTSQGFALLLLRAQ